MSNLDLPLELVEGIVREQPELGIREIFLTGEGEPFLHPRLAEIVAALKEAGIRVNLFTNGTLLDRRRIDGLVETGLDILKVSLWAVNEEEHRLCHPGVDPSLLARRLEGLELLAETKRETRRIQPRLHLHLIINRYNFRNLGERVALAENSGCEEISLVVFRDCTGRFQDLALTRAEVQSLGTDLEKAQKRLAAHGVAFKMDDYLDHARLGYRAWQEIPCYAGWYQAYIKADGRVLACPHCARPVGDLKEQSLGAIWSGPNLGEFRRLGFIPGGLDSLGLECNCANCCLIKDNLKVERVYRWIRPMKGRARAGQGAG
jgi:MoaA/NifB/PqqE/SkfB family radical SAM enzyme